jgi:hypothetical protein
MNKKGNIPAIAIAILALLFFIIVITMFSPLKDTILELIGKVVG